MTMTAAEPALDLEGLMREHQAGVWRYLRALGADPGTADDLTQETFLAVHERPFEQRSRGETSSYLRTVARNAFLKARRGAGREVSLAAVEQIEARWSELVADDGEALQAALHECLQALEEKRRHALELQYTQGMPRARIAEALGMAEEGVKTLLARTKARLRKCIERKL
jgi:RNA polymerase sigma-70 factor, ECF subfamily